MNISWKNCFLLSGAFMAFLIGSGFATGQEVLQYFASYGYKGILGIFIVFIALSYMGCSFLATGNKEKFLYSNEIYTYYCGKYLGKFYDYFSIIVIYSSFVAMVTGAGATLHQHYNVPIFIGCTIVGVLALCTVLLGLKNVICIMGNIGSINILFVLFFSISAFMLGDHTLNNATKLVDKLPIMHASSNWFMSACSYIGICILWLATFLTAMGKNTKVLKEALLGGFIGALGFSIAVLFFTLAILCNITEVYQLMIPALYLAKKIHPFISNIFSIFILICIFMASVPLLWSSASRFALEKTKKFNIIVILMALIGIFISLFVPFNIIVNYIYVINGYVGIGLFLLMCYKDLCGIYYFSKK